MKNVKTEKKCSGAVLGLAVTLVSVFVCNLPAIAQPKALGGLFSFSNIGLSYEHFIHGGSSFIDASVSLRTSEMILDRSVTPGFSGSLTWNFPFLTKRLGSEHLLNFYAGPGIVAGYEKDFKTAYGIFVGLVGKVCVECGFDRNVFLTASVSPVVGAHIVSSGKGYTMTYFKNGLLQTIMPEVGIKYRF